ncbi:uncharacterized protein LOC121969227 isoform X2 [Zingiber officinale]|uniref:uncharacterized protein LOC121969227 isoform X2 n=1 Tax=Zingiber officinale TaxID=94328 RepID=UPI001C4B3DBD|nr:uncharacterized protein LOC121969227 isoform X2 [Zingiber officinale]XP_042375148.1 uncharacterized protein LOC121969227 isoform X2 [Zingiber officinale]
MDYNLAVLKLFIGELKDARPSTSPSSTSEPGCRLGFWCRDPMRVLPHRRRFRRRRVPPISRIPSSAVEHWVMRGSQLLKCPVVLVYDVEVRTGWALIM